MSIYYAKGSRCTVIPISNETYELTKNMQNCKQNFASARRVQTKAIFLQYSQVNEAVVSQSSATCTECGIFRILCIWMSVLRSPCSEKLTARLRWLRSKRSRERLGFFILSLNTYWGLGFISCQWVLTMKSSIKDIESDEVTQQFVQFATHNQFEQTRITTYGLNQTLAS